jgi:REP element-mobilizing transposase RayT
MSQSLANIVVHLVFSTKGRRQSLRDEERSQLHAYITGILKNHESPLIEINSVRDHIHILFAQSKNHAPAKIVEQVKSSSSTWIKQQHGWYADFAWQTGYGEFSVSQGQSATLFGTRRVLERRVVNYRDNQDNSFKFNSKVKYSSPPGRATANW